MLLFPCLHSLWEFLIIFFTQMFTLPLRKIEWTLLPRNPESLCTQGWALSLLFLLAAPHISYANFVPGKVLGAGEGQGWLRQAGALQEPLVQWCPLQSWGLYPISLSSVPKSTWAFISFSLLCYSHFNHPISLPSASPLPYLRQGTSLFQLDWLSDWRWWWTEGGTNQNHFT